MFTFPVNVWGMESSHGEQTKGLLVGAAVGDLTPAGSVFLFGYPHVKRNSSGVHDRLETNALYVANGDRRVLFIANDLILVSKRLVSGIRSRISEAAGVDESCILISATHTHSGPVMVDCLSNEADAVVPPVDPDYVAMVERRVSETAIRAVRAAEAAELGVTSVRVEGTGSNRHDPRGASDPEVSVLVARSLSNERPVACMLVHAMHPTVLHEDSTLISGDFPHFTRLFLRRSLLPRNCPILFHNGASGNQSPRHVTASNTFSEACRLGRILGRSVVGSIMGMRYNSDLVPEVRTAWVELRLRSMPPLETAELQVAATKDRMDRLKNAHAPREEIRSAECDWFGAEETVALARAAAEGRTEEVARTCFPAEIQIVALGRWKWVAWPGEFFVEYALEVKAQSPETQVITMANGELQGYIVTLEADNRQCYESRNALFCSSNGQRFVETTLRLLRSLNS